MSGIRKNLFIAKCGIIFFLILSKGICFAVEQATISVVFSSDIEPYRQSYEGFKTFFDEKKVVLSVFEHNLEKENAEAVHSQIKKERPNIVFVLGTKALQLAKEKINDTPIVFSMVLNPGTITDSNIYGVSLDIPPEIKLKNIKRIIPGKKNVGIIYSPQSDIIYQDILHACTDLEFQLVSKKINSRKEFPDVLEGVSRQIDCFLMTPDTDIYFPKVAEHLLETSVKNKFPVIGLSSTYVRAGALIAFDCDYEDLGRQAGELALGILSGEKQVNTQFVKPRKAKLSLNLLTAKRLDIKIPPEIINQASEVVGK
jgi:putative ABC transport system substrate-binding protein